MTWLSVRSDFGHETELFDFISCKLYDITNKLWHFPDSGALHADGKQNKSDLS